MKSTIALLLTSVLLLQPSMGSDRPEDVIEAYEKAMRKWGQREGDFSHLYNDSEECETLFDSPVLTPSERVEAALDRAAQVMGMDRSQVMTREHMLEKNREFNSHLFHTLNAAITLISDHLEKAKTDYSHEWTYQNSGVHLSGGTKLQVSDSYIQTVLESQDGVPTVGFMSIRQMYETERQRTCFDLNMLWTILVFWKKNIFPSDAFYSYHQTNAFALQKQINDLYNRRLGTLSNISTKNTTHYAFSAVNLLKQICDALPSQNAVMVTPSPRMSSKQFGVKVDQKIAQANQLISSHETLFDEHYKSFLHHGSMVHVLLGALSNNPFVIQKNPAFVTRFKTIYQQTLESLVFPTPHNPRLKFRISPLDLFRLLPDIENVSIDYGAVESGRGEAISSAAAPSAITPSAAIPSETPQTDGATGTLVSGDNQKGKDVPSVLKEEINSDSAGAAASPSAPASSPQLAIEESSLSMESYWRTEHMRHQLRKKALPIAEGSPTITPYERELFNYLKGNIFHGNKAKLKPRDLHAGLSELHFTMESNRVGNGSSHTVKPTGKNPIFGADRNYFEAFFNVHMPAENVVIPHDYFFYLRSGFINVFGLTEDYMDERLSPSLISASPLAPSSATTQLAKDADRSD